MSSLPSEARILSYEKDKFHNLYKVIGVILSNKKVKLGMLHESSYSILPALFVDFFTFVFNSFMVASITF
uniref:Uncharacterized protein n=1 Tax=Rhizophora mucronata TaxID=61149 RepID=A0A2P2LUA2_RHIMU